MKKLLLFLLFASVGPRLLVGDDHNPIGVTGAFEGVTTTGSAYNVLNHSATRQIDDIVVPGSIGKYPLKMTRYYNSRGIGDGWSHEYEWSSHNGKVSYPNGNVWDNHCTDFWGLSEGPVGVSDWPTTWNGSPAFRLADGGTIVFGSTQWPYRATKIIDPYGQETNITLGANGLITRVTEPGGRYLQFTYNGSSLLTRVDAYDGQGNQVDYVVYHYSAIKPKNNGTQGTAVNCLTVVDYSNNTHAYYTYQDDNSPENSSTPCPCPMKVYPVVKTCKDVRFKGPMRNIRYVYQDPGPHGAILREKYWDGISGDEDNGPMVSRIDPPAPSPLLQGVTFPITYTEYRGDGPTRTFTYTALSISRPPNEDECPSVNGPAPQQFLRDYTDFRGNNTHLGYDSNWYVNSVRDANMRTTSYARGSPPPAGIGEVLTITYPGSSHIDYTYYDHGHYVHTVSNERQKVTTYTRDPDTHLVTRIDYPADASTPASHEEFTYNNFAQVLTHRLKNGAWESFVYGGRGLLTDKYNPKATVPGGSDPHTHYSYYAAADGKPGWIDRVKTMTLPANVSGYAASETYEYDLSANNTSRGLVTRTQHADGNYQSFFYDAYGNKLWEENELRKRTTYTYDDYNRVLTVRNPLNNTTQYDYASLQGNVTQAQQHTTNSPRWIIAPSGITTRNVYDEDWRKTSSTPAYGVLNPTSFVYDNVGNLTDVTDPRGKVTHHGYDNRNRKTSTTEAYGITGLAATTAWHYDNASNINQIDRPDGIHETKGYDALNRVIWHSVPRQVIGGGQVNVRTDITYNPSGTIQKVRDPNARWTNFDYDASDRKIRMTYPGTNGTQQWAYDNAGNLRSRITVRGGTEVQRFDYDNLNRKTDMSWDNNADEAHYTYYADGRLNTASNPNSTVTRQYDDAGHLTLDQQYIPGLGTKLVNYPPYDDDGRLTGVSVTNASYNYTFGYDGAGRFETISTGGSTKFEYDYDAASNETTRYTYLTGATIKQVYARDSLNRMASRVLKRNTATIAGTTEAYTYDHMNRITGVTRGDLADSFNYYWTSELLSAHYNGQADAPYTEGQEPDLDTSDTLDPSAGYQPPETEEAEPAPLPDDAAPPDPTGDTTPSPGLTPPSDVPPAEDPGKEQKTVDDYLGDGQQGPADGPGQSDFFTPRTTMYNLDKAGNRTSVTDDVNGNATYVPNVLNQYSSVGGSSVTNGPEHEIRVYSTVTYDYINDEHLKQVTSNAGTYILYYDALGRCVKRNLNGLTTYYIYDGEKPILEYRSGNLNNPAKNIYGKGIDEILMRYDPTLTQNQTFYYQQDHEGSVTHLIDTSGNLIETYRYDAFGAPAIYDVANPPHHLSSSACSNRFLFTGREYANLFGFYEYRARAYHPGLGRFMSEDPKLFVRRAGLGAAPADWTFAAHPDEAEFNLFRYCGNNPVDFTDPMGLSSPAWAQAVIPGQVEWDNAVANWHAGNHGTAIGWGITMVAQQTLAVATLGTSMRVQQSFQAVRIGMAERQAVISATSGRTATTILTKFYPENAGFIGGTKQTWLMPGQMIDRYGGSSSSRFFSPAGTATSARALPPGTESQPLRSFQVVKPFEVQSGKVAPWFYQPGGGIQHQSPIKLETLLRRGIIKEVGQ